MSRLLQTVLPRQAPGRLLGSAVALVALLALNPDSAQAFSHGGGRGHGGGMHMGGGGSHGGFHGGGFHGGGGSRHGGLRGASFGVWGSPYYDGLYDGDDEPYYGYAAPSYPAPTSVAGSYWYYCQSPAGYYPYVQQCAGPWQPVAPNG